MGFFLYITRGYARIYYLFVWCIKYKERILCVQVKNKPCVVYTIMGLIPWKRSHGSETLSAITKAACTHIKKFPKLLGMTIFPVAFRKLLFGYKRRLETLL